MENLRQNPDLILKRIKNDENSKNRGSLKIFFGYAAGVGKTYTMLEAAHDAKKKGIDIVAGYIEPHARPETAALTRGLETLPPKKIEYNGITLREFDIDGAIKRHPQLILVDELAHTNANGSRHEKRYQDVEELLSLGIDVYTTINVQHIESLNDIVTSITGIAVKERIPDFVFDRADQVEIVDIEPEDLIERLKSGKVYREAQAERAVDNFFTIENLTALREIALRRCADHVNNISENTGIKQHDDYHTEEHILVCLSSSPSNAKIIRTAARMASAFKGAFTGLFVETPEFPDMTDKDKDRLRENMKLAEQLGAKIETVYGNDVPYQIAEFARLSGVSKIVIGRSSAVKGRVFGKATLTEKLIANAPQIDIHIIPDMSTRKKYFRPKLTKFKICISDIFKTIGMMVLATIVGFLFEHIGFDAANIIMVYVLGVLVTSVITTNRIYSLCSSVLSVLVFNFFFTVPKLSLEAYDKGYPMTFFIMFISALITSSLAVKLKEHAKQSSLVAFRTKILLNISQSLQQAKDRDGIIALTANHLIELMQKDIVFYYAEDGRLDNPVTFYADDENPEQSPYENESERAVALWVLNNNKYAGATTQTLSNAKCMYFSVRVNRNIYGVIGIAVGKEPPEAFQKDILLSILGESALALENEKNAREKEEAAVLAKNEQLRANLLRAISHDLRTPLTSISGNASNFLYNGDSLDEETKKQLFTDIYDDSMWLINLVENLLSVTRLEEDRLNLHITSELVADVVDEAMKHISRKKSEHNITVEYDDDLLLARMDAKLIVQVIINIVDNAIKYTPVNSEIKVRVYEEKGMAVISVSDNGNGIPDEMKSKIFDMFYSGANKIVDSRRSLGLGLSLCKSIVSAHGGEISVADNNPHGTVFKFTLPVGEVKLYE